MLFACLINPTDNALLGAFLGSTARADAVIFYHRPMIKVPTICDRLAVAVSKLIRASLSRILPTRPYLFILFILHNRYLPDFDKPKSFNEKLQAYKMRPSHSDLYRYVDKLTAKECASAVIGEEYIIPTLAILDPTVPVDVNSLPRAFVLKANHDSGAVVLVRDKSAVNLSDSVAKLRRSLSKNYFFVWRELPYKAIKPRLFIEPLISDDLRDLVDYKFFCFNGKPKFFFLAHDRHAPGKQLKFDFFDMSLERLPFSQGYEPSDYEFTPPKCFGKMIEIASRLAEGFEHVRIDLYCVKEKIYFGEYTFYHFSGLEPFSPREYDFRLGKHWD